MASPGTGATATRPVNNVARASADANGVGATDAATAAADSVRQDRPRNRIQVSREKRPLNFFVGLAKKFLLNENEVELSGLGLAVTTVVTVAEILKSSGHVEITRIQTSLVDMHADGRASMPKAKIQIWIKKGDSWPESFAESSRDIEKSGNITERAEDDSSAVSRTET